MENVKERIIQGATELFLRQGVKAVTMDDVASSLGISKRTIYENFSDKLELLRECIVAHTCMQQEAVARMSQLSVVEVLYHMLKHAGSNMVEHQREFRFIQELKKYYPAVYDEEVQKSSRHALEKTREYVESGKEQGIFVPDTNTEMVAYIFVDQMDNLSQFDKYASFSDLATLMRHAIIIFFRGISTQKGIAEVDTMLEKLSEELKK